MNTIRLYGQLAKRIGQRVLEASISTPAEAFRFLAANFPEERQHIIDQRYAIYVGDYQLAGHEQLNIPLGQQELRIIPVFSGNIDVFGFIGDVATAVAGISTGTVVNAVIGVALSVGASYLAASLAKPAPQLSAAPSPRARTTDPRVNFSFSGVQNTARAGVPVPIVYGEIIVGSVVVSAEVDTVQVKG